MLPNLPLFRTHQYPSHYATPMSMFNFTSFSSLSAEPTESLLPRCSSGRVVAGSSTNKVLCHSLWCVTAKAGRGMRPWKKRLHKWHKSYPRKALILNFCVFPYSYCLLGEKFKWCQNYTPSEVKLQIMKCFCQQQNGWVYSYCKTVSKRKGKNKRRS